MLKLPMFNLNTFWGHKWQHCTKTSYHLIASDNYYGRLVFLFPIYRTEKCVN